MELFLRRKAAFLFFIASASLPVTSVQAGAHQKIAVGGASCCAAYALYKAWTIQNEIHAIEGKEKQSAVATQLKRLSFNTGEQHVAPKTTRRLEERLADVKKERLYRTRNWWLAALCGTGFLGALAVWRVWSSWGDRLQEERGRQSTQRADAIARSVERACKALKKTVVRAPDYYEHPDIVNLRNQMARAGSRDAQRELCLEAFWTITEGRSIRATALAGGDIFDRSKRLLFHSDRFNGSEVDLERLVFEKYFAQAHIKLKKFRGMSKEEQGELVEASKDVLRNDRLLSAWAKKAQEVRGSNNEQARLLFLQGVAAMSDVHESLSARDVVLLAQGRDLRKGDVLQDAHNELSVAVSDEVRRNLFGKLKQDNFAMQKRFCKQTDKNSDYYERLVNAERARQKDKREPLEALYHLLAGKEPTADEVFAYRHNTENADVGSDEDADIGVSLDDID